MSSSPVHSPHWDASDDGVMGSGGNGEEGEVLESVLPRVVWQHAGKDTN